MTEDSTLPVASTVGADHLHPDHVRKEGWTMALYVAICLIAALTALETVTAVPRAHPRAGLGHDCRSGTRACLRVSHRWSSGARR